MMSQENERQADAPRSHLSGSEGGPLPDHLVAADGAPLDTESENDLWSAHPNWKSSFGTVLACSGWTGLALVLALVATGWHLRLLFNLSVVVLLYGTCRVLYPVLMFHYRLTSQRLFITRGILSKTIDQLELHRVDDVRITKSLCNRMVGLGRIEVISKDQTDPLTILDGVYEPERIADLIRNQTRIMRRRSVFVERI